MSNLIVCFIGDKIKKKTYSRLTISWCSIWPHSSHKTKAICNPHRATTRKDGPPRNFNSSQWLTSYPRVPLKPSLGVRASKECPNSCLIRWLWMSRTIRQWVHFSQQKATKPCTITTCVQAQDLLCLSRTVRACDLLLRHQFLWTACLTKSPTRHLKVSKPNTSRLQRLIHSRQWTCISLKDLFPPCPNKCFHQSSHRKSILIKRARSRKWKECS